MSPSSTSSASRASSRSLSDSSFCSHQYFLTYSTTHSQSEFEFSECISEVSAVTSETLTFALTVRTTPLAKRRVCKLSLELCDQLGQSIDSTHSIFRERPQPSFCLRFEFLRNERHEQLRKPTIWLAGRTRKSLTPKHPADCPSQVSKTPPSWPGCSKTVSSAQELRRSRRGVV